MKVSATPKTYDLNGVSERQLELVLTALHYSGQAHASWGNYNNEFIQLMNELTAAKTEGDKE